MVLDVPVQKIINAVGHDGSEIIFPGLSPPYNRRSFHIQEMIDTCILRNYAVVEIQRFPVGEVDCLHVYHIPVSNGRLNYYLVNYNSVLVGTGKSGQPHAVAWDKHNVFDPNGTTYNIKRFNIETLFLIVKFNITK
jgi:hypothetical protein